MPVSASRHNLTIVLSVMAFLLLVASCDHQEHKTTSADNARQNQELPTVAKNTSIAWMDTAIDLGNALEGEMLEASFRFRNTGNEPLVISNVSPSCGCTVAEKPQEPVMPGKEGSVKVRFDSRGRTGSNHKTLNVYSNTVEGMQQLAFTVNVQEKK